MKRLFLLLRDYLLGTHDARAEDFIRVNSYGGARFDLAAYLSTPEGGERLDEFCRKLEVEAQEAELAFLSANGRQPTQVCFNCGRAVFQPVRNGVR